MENEQARLAWWRRFIRRDSEDRGEIVIQWRDSAHNPGQFRIGSADSAELAARVLLELAAEMREEASRASR